MASTPARRIAVTGGGTAGHILPAIEFLQTYRREFGAEGLFIGSQVGMESRIVPSRGERIEIVPGLPWARESWASRGRTLAGLPRAIAAARRILSREEIQLVIGTGGYTSFGVCVAARRLGLPVVVHESNAEPGTANRLIARFASLVCVGLECAAHHFGAPVVVTGTPAGGISSIRPAAGPPWLLIVLGGSEGSPLLNREAPLMFAELQRRGVDFRVRHVAAHGDVPSIEEAYRKAAVRAQVDGFVDDMSAIYHGAALAITTAGARTLAELSAAGIASLIVPLGGAARNHQNANARVWAGGNDTLIIPPGRWDAVRVAGQTAQLLANSGEMARLRQIASAHARPQAALEVVQACERLLSC